MKHSSIKISAMCPTYRNRGTGFKSLNVLNRQRGMTLMVSLVFLIILTMLGVTAVSDNSLQERMAGNTRQRDLAFQAAEAALRYAESTLPSWRRSAFDGSVQGLFTYAANEPNDAVYWRDMAHWSSSRQMPAGSLNQVAEPPRYLVHKMPSSGEVEYYRVTARGVGGDTSAVVILQSVVSYTPWEGE